MQSTRPCSVTLSPPTSPTQRTYNAAKTEELIQAYLNNDIERAKVALNHGASPNAAFGKTRLLLLAIATSNQPFVQLLLSHGAIQTEAENMLATLDLSSVRPGRHLMSEEELHTFLRQKRHLQKAPSGNLYLHELATDPGVKFSIFRHLLDSDWEVKNSNGISAFAYCCQKSPLHIVWDLVTYCSLPALLTEGLFSALKAGRTDVGLFLLDKGADPCKTDAQSNTVLHTIADAPLPHDTKMAEFIDACVRKGTPINLKNSTGKTALLVAYDNQNMTVFHALINNKAGLEAEDSGRNTILIKTIQRVDTAATRRLIQEGASRTDAYNRPLFAAIQSTNDAAVRMLADARITITKTADPNGENREKQTPLYKILEIITGMMPIADDALMASKAIHTLDALLGFGAKTTATSLTSGKKKTTPIKFAQEQKLPEFVLARLQTSPRELRERSVTTLGSAGSLAELVRSASQTPSPHSPNSPNSVGSCPSTPSSSIEDVTEKVDALNTQH